MVPAGDDFDLLYRTGAPGTVNNAVVPGNPLRPPAGKIATQGLGFADPFEGAPANVLQKSIDSTKNFLIALLPEIIFCALSLH